MPSQELLARLGVRYPIIQAPMVGVSTPALAAAVSNAGALGSIGVGASTPAQAREMLRATRALTAAPFNVNLFCHAPARFDHTRNEAWRAHVAGLFTEFDAQAPAALSEIYTSFLAAPAMLQVLLDERPAVVSFHFGVPPASWVAQLQAAGIFTLGCATSVAEAEQLASAGVGAIVAQGIEAGGHRGVFDDHPGHDHELGLFALLRLLKAATNLPIIAAGGIMDGAGIKAALALGAAAVQLGTAFILCPESAATPAHRAALAGARGYATRVTAGISGRPARGLANRLYALGGPQPAEYPLAYDLAKALHAAASAQGCDDFAAQWAGQGAPLARALPAAALVEVLVGEMGQGNPAH